MYVDIYLHCKNLLMVFIIPLRNLSRELSGLKGGEREAVSRVASDIIRQKPLLIQL